MQIEGFNKNREQVSRYRQVGKSKDRAILENTNEKYNKDETVAIRDEFIRDRDRILFSRAFRRLEHKAQIYSHRRGDHFRTRLTHSLEVMQIGKSISRNLGLNDNLVEAIALGHDIGHTPFGHQGERVLNEILTGRDDLGKELDYLNDFGGFKHNYHGLRLLECIEIKSEDYRGMNLTWQVLEGILKHTKIKDNNGNLLDLERSIGKEQKHRMHVDFDHSVTLEGQIIAIADEIAQRQHDLDDGFRDIGLGLSIVKVVGKIINELDKIKPENKTDFDTREEKFKNAVFENYENLKEKLQLIDKEYDRKKELYLKNKLIRDIIEFFIYDVTINSARKITKYDKESDLIEDKLIVFSEFGNCVNEVIENIINIQILNSYDVSRFDGKAKFIIRQLFKAYYHNPRQMPKYMLKRIESRIEGYLNDNKIEIKIKNNKMEWIDIKEISFTKSKREVIKTYLDILKLEFISLEMEYKHKDNIELFIFEKYNDIKTDKLKEVIKKIHYYYLITITDYIAGMTDNYAESEYNKLYLV